MPDRPESTASTAVCAVLAVVLMPVAAFGLMWASAVGEHWIAGSLLIAHTVSALVARDALRSIRRPGRAASPPARTEITRTTGGPA